MEDVDDIELDRRQRLHLKLDEILDERAKLEAQAGVAKETQKALMGYSSYAHLSSSSVARPAVELATKGASLAAEAVGVPMRCAALQPPANDGPGERDALRRWLSVLQPMLDLPMPTILGGVPNSYLADYQVWLGLRALDAGEVWPIFQPGRRGNRPANLYSLSVARLSALEWKRRLVAAGHSEGDANREITASFGEQWDTIRKWEKSCREILGIDFVAAALSRAEFDRLGRPVRVGGFFSGLGRTDPIERLRQAGSQYRTEKQRAAKLSPAKQRAARRLEKQSEQISG